jgi:hypothetical protein
MNGILIDFGPKPIKICDWCGHPFNATNPRHIKSIDCPLHEPAHWKYYRRQEQLEIDKAIEADAFPNK